MKLRVARPPFLHYFRSIVGLLVMGSAFVISGCSGDDPLIQSNAQAITTLNSEILSAPLSTTEADRFFAVAATTGNRYYTAGFTTVTDDGQMALARFGPTGGLDTSFGSNGLATVNVAVGAGKKAELARSVVVQFRRKNRDCRSNRT